MREHVESVGSYQFPHRAYRAAPRSNRRVNGLLSFHMQRILVSSLLLLTLLLPPPAPAADSGFTQFIASLWPEAQAAGVSRATFDAETSGLEPDYKLPDLILPGRPATGAPSQAEFVQVPADYIKEASIARLAEEGQRLMQKHRAALSAIEAQIGRAHV